jgi:hypothetical protein
LVVDLQQELNMKIVSQIMTREVKWCTADESVAEALHDIFETETVHRAGQQSL